MDLDQEKLNSVDIDFSEIARMLDAESSLRETLRDRTRTLETHVRSVISILNAIHGAKESQIESITQRAQAAQSPVVDSIASIAEIIPDWTYYRYHDTFSRSLQNAVFGLLLIAWLKDDRLLSKTEASNELKIESLGPEHFQLPTEDYLHAAISLISELARLAPNAVTQARYDLPLRISRFCKELASGFALLNLKNDSLRRRFDSIKYEIKRIEEVVYDISLRGLLPAGELVEGAPKTKRQRSETEI